jgi:cell division protein FtsB
MPSIELIAAVLTALLGTLPPLLKVGLTALYKSSARVRHIFDTSLGRAILKGLDIKEADPSPTKGLLAELRTASAEMDRIVDEIGRYTEERQSTVLKLEGDLQALSQREQELKKRIEGLQQVPLPAAEYFAKLVERTEKKSATRDYVLFLLGVVASAVVVVILKAFGV